MTFSDFIKNYRGHEGISQKALADMLNVSQRTISFYENGGFPNEPRIINGLAKLTGVCIDDINAMIKSVSKDDLFLIKLTRDTVNKNISWELFRDYINGNGSDNIDEEQWDQEMDADDSYCFDYKNVTYLLYKKNVNEMPTLILRIRYNDTYRDFSDNIKSGHILSLYNAIKASFSPFGGIIDDFLNEDFSKE